MHSRSSLEYLSIFCYLKEGVLAKNYLQEVQNDSLVYDTSSSISGAPRTDYKVIDSASSTFGSYVSSRGRGWPSFEQDVDPCMVYDVNTSGYVSVHGIGLENSSYRVPTEREQTTIKVRDQYGSILPREYYQLDYIGCRVRWPVSTTPSGALGNEPTKIDYKFHMVSLCDGYPSNETMPPLPVVCIYPLEEEGYPLQIGPGLTFTKKYAIDVFARNKPEQINLLNILHDSLYGATIPVIDFNRTGDPLKHWGVINNNFIQDITYRGHTYRSYLTLNSGNGNTLCFKDLKIIHGAESRDSRADSIQHTGKIVFSSYSFTDRDPKLVGKFNTLEDVPGGLDSLLSR